MFRIATAVGGGASRYAILRDASRRRGSAASPGGLCVDAPARSAKIDAIRLALGSARMVLMNIVCAEGQASGRHEGRLTPSSPETIGQACTNHLMRDTLRARPKEVIADSLRHRVV